MITKGTRSGLSSVEVYMVMVRECFCPCDIVNLLYFPLKEIEVINTFVKIVTNFIGT